MSFVASATNAAEPVLLVTAPAALRTAERSGAGFARWFDAATPAITPARVVSTLAGQEGIKGGQDGIGKAATFNQPQGLTINAAGTLYVADTFGNLIRKVTPVQAP